MDTLEKANIPEFIRSNDGTNRIKNLEEIRSIVRELNSTDLFTLYDRLHWEFYEFGPSMLEKQREIYAECAMRYTQIVSEWEKKAIFVRKMLEATGQMDRRYEFAQTLKDEVEIAMDVEELVSKVTCETIDENYQEILRTYRVYVEEIQRRWKRIKKIKRIIVTTAAALVGIFIMSKSENVDRFIKSSWEKIHQILSSQE